MRKPTAHYILFVYLKVYSGANSPFVFKKEVYLHYSTYCMSMGQFRVLPLLPLRLWKLLCASCL
jgi:hypothetical protein